MNHATCRLGIAYLRTGPPSLPAGKDLSPFLDRDFVVRYWHPSIRNGIAPFLAIDRVRYVGEPVAFLVAEDRYQAEDSQRL